MVANLCLHFTKNRLIIPMHIEIVKQPIILKPHTKLSFSSNNPYFYSIPPQKYSTRTHISHTRFEEKLDHNPQWLEEPI